MFILKSKTAKISILVIILVCLFMGLLPAFSFFQNNAQAYSIPSTLVEWMNHPCFKYLQADVQYLIQNYDPAIYEQMRKDTWQVSLAGLKETLANQLKWACNNLKDSSNHTSADPDKWTKEAKGKFSSTSHNSFFNSAILPSGHPNGHGSNNGFWSNGWENTLTALKRRPAPSPDGKPDPNNPSDPDNPNPSGPTNPAPTPQEQPKPRMLSTAKQYPSGGSEGWQLNYYHYCFVVQPYNLARIYDVAIEPGGTNTPMLGIEKIESPTEEEYKTNPNMFAIPEIYAKPYEADTNKFYQELNWENITNEKKDSNGQAISGPSQYMATVSNMSMLMKVGCGGKGTLHMNWWVTVTVGDLGVNWFRTFKDGGYPNVPCVNFYGKDSGYWIGPEWGYAETESQGGVDKEKQNYDQVVNIQFDIDSPGRNSNDLQKGKAAEDTTEIVITATTEGGLWSDPGRGLPNRAAALIQDPDKGALPNIQKLIKGIQEVKNTGKPYKVNKQTGDYDPNGVVLEIGGGGTPGGQSLTPEGVRNFWNTAEPNRRNSVPVYENGMHFFKGGSSRYNDLFIVKAWYNSLIENRDAYSFGAKYNPANWIRNLLKDIVQPVLTWTVAGVKKVIMNGSTWITNEILKDGNVTVVTYETKEGLVTDTVMEIQDADQHSAVIFLYDFVQRIAIILFILVVLVIGLQLLKESLLVSGQGGESAKAALPRFIVFGIMVFFAKYVMLLVLYVNNIMVKAFFDIKFFREANILVSLGNVGLGEMIWVCIVAILLILGALCIYFAYVYRTAALCALLVISPLAFLCGILDSTKEYFQKWWSYTLATIFIQFIHTIVYCTFIAIWASVTSSSGVGLFASGDWIDTISKYMIALCAMILTLTLPPKIMSGAIAGAGSVARGYIAGRAITAAAGGAKRALGRGARLATKKGRDDFKGRHSNLFGGKDGGGEPTDKGGGPFGGDEGGSPSKTGGTKPLGGGGAGTKVLQPKNGAEVADRINNARGNKNPDELDADWNNEKDKMDAAKKLYDGVYGTGAVSSETIEKAAKGDRHPLNTDQAHFGGVGKPTVSPNQNGPNGPAVHRPSSGPRGTRGERSLEDTEMSNVRRKHGDGGGSSKEDLLEIKSKQSKAEQQGRQIQSKLDDIQRRQQDDNK